MSVFYLTHEDDVPKSFNHVGGRGSYRAWHTQKKKWQGIFIGLIDNAEIPRDTGLFVKTTAILTFPVIRRRDTGNFGAVVEKALGDALTDCLIIPDDTPEHWSWTSLTFQHVPGKKATTLVIELVDDFEMAPCCAHAEHALTCEHCARLIEARILADQVFGNPHVDTPTADPRKAA